tara:strand:+ start:3807 stop:5951 length:2145 start_codon:yes stop_codon:yes gene_type:complete
MFKKNNESFYILLLILWPYLFLFPYTFELISVGNDFDLIYFSYKRYIAELLSSGVIPFWSPAEGTGLSLIFNPFSQYFYIPGWINYIIYFIKNNLSLHDYVVYTISAFSIYSLGIFFWLRSLKIDFWIAFTVSIVTVCSLKITETIRFPNAAHSAAWMPWILYGINLINKNFTLKNFLLIFLSNFFLVTAGYPYFIVYSLFLFIPYIIIFVPIVLKKRIFSKDNFLQYTKTSLPFISSYLLASPWLIKVKSFLKSLVDRTNANWEFATEHDFFWKDTLGSWIFPPASSTEGWYYFGIITTILIFFSLYIFFFKKKFFNEEKNLILYPLFFILFITYFSWGEHSIIFKWFWKYVPLIDSLRTWPRINIILLPFIALLLSVSIKQFYQVIKTKKNYINLLSNDNVKIFLFISLSIFILQITFIKLNFYNDEYWNFWQKKRFDYAIENLPYYISYFLQLYNGLIYIIFNFIILFIIIFVFFKKKIQINNLKIYVSIFVIMATTFELFALSNIQWSIIEWKTKIVKTEKPLDELKSAFISKRILGTVKGNQYFRDNKKFNINYPDNYGYDSHAKNFSTFFKRYNGEIIESIKPETINSVKKFYGLDEDAKKIFFTKSNYYIDINSFVQSSEKDELSSKFQYNFIIEKYDGNTLEINISTESNGYLSYIDNWDPDWVAFINNRQVNINKLFNSYKIIKIKKGFSNIKFQYKPWSSYKNF